MLILLLLASSITLGDIRTPISGGGGADADSIKGVPVQDTTGNLSDDDVLRYDSGTNEWLYEAPPGASGGEANTLADTGTFNGTEGFGLAGGKTGTALKVKGIIEGANIVIAGSGDSAYTITATNLIWVEGTDSLFAIDSDGDTMAVFWDDDAGNVRWQVAKSAQTLRIDADTIFVGDPQLQDGPGDTAIVNIATADPGRFMTGEADAHFGDSTGGIVQAGMGRIGMHSDTTYNTGLLNLDRTMLFMNNGSPPGNFEFLFCETFGNSAIRLGIPKSGAGLGTWNARSGFFAGPSVYHDSAAIGTYWGFDSLAMDTDTDGADLGVQNDVQINGELFIDSIRSAGQAELNIDQNLGVQGNIAVTGTVDSVDVAALGATVPKITDDTTNYQTAYTHSQVTTGNPHTVLLNEVGNPSGNKTFGMGAFGLTFNYTGAVGNGLELNATGVFTGNILHVHQHTGNVGTTHLAHFEATDPDVLCLEVMHAGRDTLSIFSGGLSVFDSISIEGAFRVGGASVFEGTITIPDFILYTGGDNGGAYDSTDAPADGDQLTWNTGGVIDWQVAGGGGGEANTLADTGTFNGTEGFGMAGGKTGTALKVKGLIEGTGTIITPDGDSAYSIAPTLGTAVDGSELDTGLLDSITTGYDHAGDNSQAHTDYMLNTGDIVTGVYDFGGAVLEIPNSDDPTTDANGEIAQDNNGNAIEVYIPSESESGLIPFYRYISIPIVEPDSVQAITPDLKVYHIKDMLFPYGIEIDSVELQLDSDEDVSVVVEEWSGADPPVFQSIITTIATTGGSDTYAIEAPDNDAVVDAGDWIVLDLPTGTAGGYINIGIYFHVTEGN